MILRPTRLPNEYQEVEYIQTDGTQYINLGVNAFDVDTINIKLSYTELVADAYILGGRDTNVGYRIYLYEDEYISSGNKLLYRVLGNRYLQSTTLDINTIYNIESCLKQGNQYMKINGETVASSAEIVTYPSGSNYPLYLFSFVTGISPAYHTKRARCKMYSCKLYSPTDELVRDLVPCYRKSNNKPGMYDTVDNVFYTNSGSGADFEVGNDVKTVTDIKLNNTPIDILKIRNKIAWKRYIEDIFCLKAIDDEGTTITTIKNGTFQTLPSLEYSLTNQSTWLPFVVAETSVFLRKNQKIYIRATSKNETFSNINETISFKFTGGKVEADGDITYLIDKNATLTIPERSTCYFRSLFENCSLLTKAPKLPATRLQYMCYSFMFSKCTNLTNAPELPSLSLAEDCYNGMFDNCTSLVSAPNLPATTLATSCYSWMFFRCSSLTTAPELPAVNLEDNCYLSMFSGCTSLNYIKTHQLEWGDSSTLYWTENVNSVGTFVCSTSLEIIRGKNNIPTNWTIENF